MIYLNKNYAELKDSYLFAGIAKKTQAYLDSHPGQKLYRMGIGDVSQPLCPAVIDALHAAVEAQAHAESFHGYQPECGAPFFREAVAALYRRSGCDGFVAIGGGSPMDAAKAAAARIARPDRTVAQMGGLMKVGRTIPPFIAVPTTAGTGSETTMAAVVTGADHHKYALGDLHLIPRYAILDPALTVSLPPDITAQTGMDALTHAVEAYCNRFYNTNQTRRLAEAAAADIFRYLPIACENGADLEAREKLLTASFHAGCAFTRAGVGNVHAIAHTLGGLYGVGHGLANAVLLPVVLRDYGAAVTPRLSRLAQCAGIRGGAAGFVDAIFAMNEKLGIPRGFSCIREEDIPRMTAWADAEANPAYPVPVIYDRARFAQIIRQIRQE